MRQRTSLSGPRQSARAAVPPLSKKDIAALVERVAVEARRRTARKAPPPPAPEQEAAPVRNKATRKRRKAEPHPAELAPAAAAPDPAQAGTEPEDRFVPPVIVDYGDAAEPAGDAAAAPAAQELDAEFAEVESPDVDELRQALLFLLRRNPAQDTHVCGVRVTAWEMIHMLENYTTR